MLSSLILSSVSSRAWVGSLFSAFSKSIDQGRWIISGRDFIFEKQNGCNLAEVLKETSGAINTLEGVVDAVVNHQALPIKGSGIYSSRCPECCLLMFHNWAPTLELLCSKAFCSSHTSFLGLSASNDWLTWGYSSLAPMPRFASTL